MSKTNDRAAAYFVLRADVLGWHDREIARLERDIAALHLRVRMTTADLGAARSAKEATMRYLREIEGIPHPGDKENP